jgi:hypothetical protein
MYVIVIWLGFEEDQSKAAYFSSGNLQVMLHEITVKKTTKKKKKKHVCSVLKNVTCS